MIATKEELEVIYNEYIYATNCDLCGIKFKNRRDRQMEHNHENGEFRNIVCHSCNMLKKDVKMKSHNTSGYKGIDKLICIRCKQGFRWRFRAVVDGKAKAIKYSVNLDKLIEFANKWKIDNNYHT